MNTLICKMPSLPLCGAISKNLLFKYLSTITSALPISSSTKKNIWKKLQTGPESIGRSTICLLPSINYTCRCQIEPYLVSAGFAPCGKPYVSPRYLFEKKRNNPTFLEDGTFWRLECECRDKKRGLIGTEVQRTMWSLIQLLNWEY